MKILQAGNMVNIGYLTSTLLRNYGLDVDLLLDVTHPCPEKFDPKLLDGYPSWFIQYHLNKKFWKVQILKTMRKKKYDLIHAYVELPIFSYLSGKTFMIQALGSDFRELAISNSLRGKLLLKAYKKAKVILFSMPDHLPLYRKLNLNNGIFFPLPVDLTFFKPMYHEQYNSQKFVIFHPTNLDWAIKRNDILIHGYAKFIKNNPNSLLLIIDRGVDSIKTKKLIHDLNLDAFVEYVDGPINSSKMREYYNSVDIIADAFLHPAMSGTTNESLCCKKPVVCFYPKKEFEGVYEEHPPIMNARNPDEVCSQFEKLSDKNFRDKVGKQGYEWVHKYNDPAFYSKKLSIIYETILDNGNVNEIKNNLKRITTLKEI
jgi:hypothetical protein